MRNIFEDISFKKKTHFPVIIVGELTQQETSFSNVLNQSLVKTRWVTLTFLVVVSCVRA